MRQPFGAILPAVLLAAPAAALDSVTAITAFQSAAGLGVTELSPWATQAAVGAVVAWAGVVLAVVGVIVGSALLRLGAGFLWLIAAGVTWATPTSWMYVSCGLVALLAGVDQWNRRRGRHLRWSERNGAVRAGLVVTLAGGPLSLVVGPLVVMLTVIGTTLMVVGSMAEGDGLHGGEGSAFTSPSTDAFERARLRRRRIHAANLSLGAGLIALANLLYALIDPPTTGIEPAPLILIGGLFLVAVPMLAIGLGLAAWAISEGRRLARKPPEAEHPLSARVGS